MMLDWSAKLDRWTPPAAWRRLLAVDAHTEGEPLRVVVSGFPCLRGRTMSERRREARRDHDTLRRALMWEPRGHADMYGCLVGPPLTDDADISVLFTHNDGFSTMCGHGIIGVVTALLETGLLDAPEVGGREGIGIDTPAGLVRATAVLQGDRVAGVSFVNVPSFAARLDATVDVPGIGAVAYDLAYGGAFYAYVEAGDFDLRLEPAEVPRLVELGRRIKEALQVHDPPEHPDAPDLGFVYGTIFVGEAQEAGHHSRNVCVFADGEVDRCPTGTGVSGRLAIHHARGELSADGAMVVESILGTRFRGRIVGRTRVGGLDAVVPEVTGRAWITGVNELLVDPSDPLAAGFLLR